MKALLIIQQVEIAKARAEESLADLAASGWQPGQAAEGPVSMDRECPVCGLVQPDDDSTDCWACGATLNLDDVDPTMCECGNPGFSFMNGRWYCYPCIEGLAEGEAERMRSSSRPDSCRPSL